jgi:hypothetical protein
MLSRRPRLSPEQRLAEPESRIAFFQQARASNGDDDNIEQCRKPQIFFRLSQETVGRHSE